MAQWDAIQSELPRRLLSLSSLLTLEKLDERSWLVARIGRQGLNLLGEDGGGTHDELAITPHQSPNHRQRSHVYSSQSYTVKTLRLWLAPCTAALYSTASSGLMDVFGSCREDSWTMGSHQRCHPQWFANTSRVISPCHSPVHCLPTARLPMLYELQLL